LAGDNQSVSAETEADELLSELTMITGFVHLIFCAADLLAILLFFSVAGH
jgi:hypothetical protein